MLLFWQAFTDLDSSRITGMEASPIQPSQVLAWCNLHAVFCPQLVEDIWQVTHAVDRHRMISMREAQQREQKQMERK